MNKIRLRLATAILLALAACSSPLSDPLGDAKSAFEKQDYLAARDHAQAAVRENGADAETLAMLARAQLAVGEGANALATLDRLKATGSMPPDGILLQAEARLQNGEAQAARDLIRTETTAEAWRLRALAYAQDDNEADALDAFRQGRAAAGEKVRLYAAEASYHLTRGNADAARDPVALAQQAGPERLETLFVSARLAQMDGNADFATRAYLAILEISPYDRPALLGAIGEMGTLGRIDLLRPLLARGVEAYPGDPEFGYLAARLKAQDGDWEGVRTMLQQREATLAAHPETRGLYAEALLELGQLELARSHIAPLYRQLPDNPQAARIYARVLVELGERAEAARVIAPLAALPDALPEDRELAARANRS